MDLTTEKKPSIVSLFSGAGGLDIGFHKAGFHTVFATDIWDKACETLKLNKTADEVYCGDIRKIDFAQIKESVGQVYLLKASKCKSLTYVV